MTLSLSSQKRQIRFLLFSNSAILFRLEVGYVLISLTEYPPKFRNCNNPDSIGAFYPTVGLGRAIPVESPESGFRSGESAPQSNHPKTTRCRLTVRCLFRYYPFRHPSMSRPVFHYRVQDRPHPLSVQRPGYESAKEYSPEPGANRHPP